MAPNPFRWLAAAGDKDAPPRGTPVVVKMESPNFSIVEIDGPDAAFKPVEKCRLRNAKQVKWILLLKANRAVGCVARFAGFLLALLGGIRRRLVLRQGVAVASEKMGRGNLMLGVIKILLLISLAILAVEILAYLNGSDLSLYGIHAAYVGWLEFRGRCIAPVVQYLSTFCVVLFIVQSVDRLILCMGCAYIRMKNIRPEINGGDPFSTDYPKREPYDYPMVLVQIPMCNEREVLSISYQTFQFLVLIDFT